MGWEEEEEDEVLGIHVQTEEGKFHLIRSIIWFRIVPKKNWIMSSGILRRRVHHEDVGGGKYERVLSNGSDGVSEPLLGADYYDQRSRQAYYVSL